MSSVILQRLEKTYPAVGIQPAFQAVKGIDLEIADREFMVLVGPSGCGKSTTLRMIAGLEEITGGACRIGDRVVNALPPKDRDIAMVFQNYALYPHMTVFDNMAFGLSVRKRPKDEIARRVREAAAVLGIEDLLGRKPKALSGGQRQRVALGRAIVRQPGVFLFDEPLSNLDAKMRVHMRNEIARLHRRLETTMIYVTHDQAEAMTLGDRICVMREGVIQQVGAPMDVYHQPANTFVAGFIGNPPMNLIRGSFRPSADRLRFVPTQAEAATELHIDVPADFPTPDSSRPEQDVLLGLRPEALEDRPAQPRDGVLSARVELAEPMGAETFLHLKSPDGSPLIARVAPDLAHPHGFVVNLAFKPAKAFCFDPDSGQRL